MQGDDCCLHWLATTAQVKASPTTGWWRMLRQIPQPQRSLKLRDALPLDTAEVSFISTTTETFKSGRSRSGVCQKHNRPLHLVSCHMFALWFAVRWQLMNLTWLESKPCRKDLFGWASQCLPKIRKHNILIYTSPLYDLFLCCLFKPPILPVQWRKKGLQLVRTPCSEKSRRLSSGCFLP